MAQNAMNYAVAGIKMMPQLFARNSATIAKRLDEVVVQCGSDNDYNGRMGVRISAIFVILVGSTFGKSISSIIASMVLIYGRSRFPGLCSPEQVSTDVRMGVLHREILWLRRHCCYRIHPRE